MVSWITRWPAKPMIAPGSARCTSPSMAKDAVTPPVVGSVSTTTNGRPFSLMRSTAATVRGICISDRMPSCMRAPPEDGNTTRAAFWASASLAARTRASPTPVPIEPPMKPKSNTAATAGTPPTVPCATTMASPRPDFDCASRRRSE